MDSPPLIGVIGAVHKGRPHSERKGVVHCGQEGYFRCGHPHFWCKKLEF